MYRYDFVCLPMVNPRFKRESIYGPAKNRKCALTRSDMSLTSQGKMKLHLNISSLTVPWLERWYYLLYTF